MKRSEQFMKWLAWIVGAWFVLGLILSGSNSYGRSAFIQIFLFTALDLVFLIRIFWNLFTQRAKTIQTFIFVLFKLVCLGFLAITLKRFNNAPALSLFMGLGVIVVAPLLAGIASEGRS